MKRSFTVEILLITVIGLIYFAFHAVPAKSVDYSLPTLDLRPIANLLLDPSIRPTGIEHERLAGVILPIQIGLQRYGHIPFWNSYLSNGVPLINNAFSYLFNPFHSLPVLILGGVTGSKVATIIALLIAGYSMWTFGLAIGLGAVARVTVGLLYMLNGSIAAKFGAGHFQLACSLAWPPLVLATLWWTLHSSKRRAPIAVGISFALLLYAGNIYYVLHTGICCLVIVALHLIERHQDRWHFRGDRLRRAIIAGLFAFGLSALQFFPVWQVRDFIIHGQQDITANGGLVNNYDLVQTVKNLTQPWQDWQPQSQPMIDSVDYAYVGNMVVVLILLVFALYLVKRLFHRKQNVHEKKYIIAICASILLAIMMMVWAGGQLQPIPWLYAHMPLLGQFRYIGRALSIAALWWILLAGISLDILWNWICQYATEHIVFKRTSRRWLIVVYILVTLAWLFMFIYSASLTPDRIAMVMRNISWWILLDAFRFHTLPDALGVLIQLLIAVTVIDALILLGQHLITVFRHKQKFSATSFIMPYFQTALLFGIAFGVINVMTTNTSVFQFSAGNVTFDGIYNDIRRLDTTPPFPTVNIPFSPYSFGSYEHEIRNWPLDEGWLPAAPIKPTLRMTPLSNIPRWLITGRTIDGKVYDARMQTFIESAGYELRDCYISGDTIMLAENCSIRKIGFNLYEYPQALPYAFIVAEPILTNNAANLHADQVKPADVLLYQQDNIVIHTAATWPDYDKHYLVVQEASFPGWQVTVDGVAIQPMTVPTRFFGEQPIGLIAIPLAEGDHTYALRFDPPGFSTGILVFFGTLIAIVAYLKLARKQKSPA